MWLLILSLAASPLLLAQQVRIGGEAPNPEKERAQAVERARSLLRETLQLPASEEIAVESAKAVKWPDASLGCPEKGRMYAQVVTPGWLVVLRARGRTHELHLSAKRVVECPAKDKPGTPQE